MRRSLIVVFILVLVSIEAVSSSTLASSQEVDPFYLKALADGESLFRAKSFSAAVSRLEIAAFGLYAQPAALGKARLLLGLSYAYLNDPAKTESYLKAAYAVLGPAGIAEISLPDSARADLLRLARTYKLDAPTIQAKAPPPDIKPSGPTAPATSKSAPATVSSAQRSALEKEIRDAPRQTASYYELAALHEAAGDRKSAGRVFRNLLANIPAEIRAWLEIGRLQYLDRSLKDAEKSLDKFLSLAADIPTDARMLVSARAYLILSAHLRGDGAKARQLVRDAPLLDDALIASLGLLPEDRDRLLRILGR